VKRQEETNAKGDIMALFSARGMFLSVVATVFLATGHLSYTGPSRAGAQAEGAPTSDQIANASYRGIYDEPVSLTGGVWEGEAFAPGGASRPRVELVRDFRLTADMDGDGGDEAVVLLSETSGGTATNLYLAVVGWSGAEIVNMGTALVGDRVQVRAARVQDEGIELDVVQSGPEDAACCPSQKATRKWTLKKAGLSEGATQVTGTLSIQDLIGPEWALTHLSWDEKVPQEPKITLVFEGQRVTGRAGCNHYFAQVESGLPGGISVGPIGSTQRACPEEVMALEQRYLKALGGVSKYSFLAGKLALTVQGPTGSSTLLFEPTSPDSQQ
jgi:heat shock protein HslJ